MPSAPGKLIILITGATNGIGLDTTIYLASASETYHVIMGARNPNKASSRLKELAAKNLKGTLSTVHLDTTSDTSILAAVASIERDFGRLDVLINNAGVCLEDPSAQWPTRDTLRNTFETNVYGPTILTSSLVPLLNRSKNPRIINVSSGLGSIAALFPEFDPSNAQAAHAVVNQSAYRMSKAALNMLTAYQYHSIA